MGRFAQRRIRGGGPPSPTVALNRMNSAAPDVFNVEVAYEQDIDATTLAGPDFTSNPSGNIGAAILQLATNTIQIAIDTAGVTDVSITYAGPNPTVESPQTQNY